MSLTEWTKAGRRWVCAKSAERAARGRRCRGLPRMRAGLRDYVDKNGFPGVVLGLSGGIDSALVAAMAVDALGRRASTA